MKARFVRSDISKFVGLMFQRPYPLVFVFEKPKRIGLHMFFVFWPIDVFFMDDKFRVLEVKRNFLPFSFYTSKCKASYVLEAPVGLLHKKVGEVLNFDPV